MPKVPRDVSHDALVRFLKKRGWIEAQHGSKHTLLKRGDEYVTIPRHTKIKTGTLSAILKATGVTVEEAAQEL